VQVAGLEELESELASGHGGVVVRLTVGRPSPAERGCEKCVRASPSSGGARARETRVRGSTEGRGPRSGVLR